MIHRFPIKFLFLEEHKTTFTTKIDDDDDDL